MTQFVPFDSPDALMSGLALAVAQDLQVALENKPLITLAIPGGTTPAPFFDILAKAKLEWSRVRVMLTDERYLPEGNSRSNTGLVKRHLLQKNAAAAQMVPFYVSGVEVDDFVADHATVVADCLPIDVCVLGMGADMHTASLFPDSAELGDALVSERPLHVVRPASQPEARLTLTGSALASAAKTYVLIVGADKKAALERAQGETSSMVAPIRAVFGEHTSIYWADK
jgi:6-phosphogluconolactonase